MINCAGRGEVVISNYVERQNRFLLNSSSSFTEVSSATYFLTKADKSSLAFFDIDISLLMWRI